jgi:hypothetical protein
MPRKKGSKALILEFFLANIGVVLDSKDIREASGGASEWGRRTRELREDDGYQILSHKDRAELTPGQYLLETTKRLPAFRRDISKETRAWVLERNGYTCQMCGVAAGDPDPLGGTRPVRLTMGHIKDKSKGGDDSPQKAIAAHELPPSSRFRIKCATSRSVPRSVGKRCARSKTICGAP